MDKYEYKVRSEEIKSLIGQGNYVQAAEIADTIDWRRVKSVMMLCTVSDLYKINRRFEDAKNMLLLAYERRPGGRTICYSLCELCTKTGEFVQALKYYKEFIQVAPRDTGRYILQYKLYEAQEVSLEERISVLEELKKRDYREKWAYELAYLYHRVGLATRCVEECDELILWFGDGKYVVKAMELKMLHQPLTPAQKEIYGRRFEKETLPEQVQEEEDGAGYGQESLDGQEAYWLPEEHMDEGGQEAAYAGGSAPGQVPSEEMDIQVKTMDVGKYNTINLQEELAAGLQEVLEAEDMAQRGTIAEENPQAYAREAQEPEESGYQDSWEDEIEDSEVFFGATGEMEDALPELETDQEGAEPMEESAAQDAEASDGWIYEPRQESVSQQECCPGEQAFGQEPEETADEAGVLGQKEALTRENTTVQGGALTQKSAMAQEKETEVVVPGEAACKAAPQEKESHQENAPESLSSAQPPREMAEVLSQEANGQISMVLPESVVVEKQITGQMKLDDILVEWERIKKENEAKCQEEVRRHVLTQTGPMFTEFEANIRDGLLEQLEKGEPGQIDSAEQTEPCQAMAETGAQQDQGMAGEEAKYAGELEAEDAEYGEAEELEAEEAGYGEAGELEAGDAEYGEAEELEAEDAEYGEAEELTAEEAGYGGTGELEAGDVEYGEAEELEAEEAGYGEAEDAEYIDTEEDALYGVEGAEPGEMGTEAEEEFSEEDADAANPGYAAGQADEAEYVQQEAYEQQETYEQGDTYIEDAGYEAEAGAEDEPLNDEYADYMDALDYEEEFGTEDEPEYGEAGDGQTGYKEENGTENEPEYIGEAEFEYEAEYEEEAEYAGDEQAGYEEDDYREVIEEAEGTENAGDTDRNQRLFEDSRIEEEDIVDEIEEIQEQIEAAERPERSEEPGETESGPEKGDKSFAEHDHAKVRGLTREEKELFAPYIQNRRSREQLVKALDGISMAAYTGNLIITGEEGMDTLTLAKNMMREIRMTDSNFSGKVAKVSGQGLNEKNVAETLEQLRNGALIIQKASGMSVKTAAMLHRQLQQERFGIIVVLEDTQKAIKKLFLGTPDLYGDFTARVDLEALSNDALVAFGRQYAREKEYSIDNLGVLALHTRIEEMQTIDHVVTVMEVKQIMDEAMHRASRKTLGHFFDILLARRYDDEDMVILTEKDFVA